MVSRSRCFRKAGPQEQQQIEELLGHLKDEQGENPVQPLSGSAVEACRAMVPYVQHEPQDSQEASSSNKGGPVLELEVDPAKIFQAVLDRPSLDDDYSDYMSPDRHKTTSMGEKKPSPVRFKGFLDGLMNKGHLDAAEKKILLESQKQKPLNFGYSSQLQRANKESKKQAEQEEEEEEHTREVPKGKKRQATCRPKAAAKSQGGKGEKR